MRGTILGLSVLALQLACSPPAEEPAPPAPPARPAAKQLSPVRIVQTPAQVRLAGLERALDETTRWQSQSARKIGARVDRWRAYARSAEGTEYAAAAAMELQVLERIADQAGRQIESKAADACLINEWPQALQLLRTFVRDHPQTPAAARALARHQALERWHRAATRAQFRIRIGFRGQQAWQPSSGPVRLAGARDVGPPHKAWERLIFSRPGTSMLGYRFTLEQRPARLWLLVRHFSGFAGLQYSTLTLTINNAILAGGWQVNHTYHAYTNVWELTPHLRDGANTLTWRFGIDSLTNYWLYGFELTDVDPTPLLR